MQIDPIPPRPDDLLPTPPVATWTPPPPPVPPLRYASFWIRLGAYLIDTLVLLPLTLPLLIAIGNRVSHELDRFLQTNARMDLTPIYRQYFGWGLLVGAGVFAYQVLMVRYFGGTLGKLAVGIRVRVAGTGAVAGWREALLRPVLQTIVGAASFVPGARLITLIDDLWMVWDGQSQTLHDKVANTIVIYAP
jgi:uncharacterized RDD family membrane protein YckC